MAKPFKFRYVNEIVGTFVLLVILLLVAGIILAGHAQEWFVARRIYHVDFPVEGSLGIQKGAPVQILGTTVGRVLRIHVEEDGRMSGVIVVQGDFIRFVREDSEVIVRKLFGVAGDAYLEITQGKGEPLPPDFNLSARKDTEITEVAQQILKQIQDATLPALEKITLAIEEYTKLAADLRDAEGPLMKLISNLEQLTAGLQQGEGTAGQLLRDPAIANETRDAIKKVSESLEEVKVILGDVQQTTSQLPPMAARIGRETEDLPGTVLQTQETLRETEKLIEGVQRHWLIRKYVPDPAPSDTIPAAEVVP